MYTATVKSNPLPQKKKSTCMTRKHLHTAVDNLNVAQIIHIVLNMLGNIVEKMRKLLLTCIFSFSRNVFKRIFHQGHFTPDCVVKGRKPAKKQNINEVFQRIGFKNIFSWWRSKYSWLKK